jgi:hypothetical protein
MTALEIVLLVCFVVIMMIWLLDLLGAVGGRGTYSPWLAFLSCFILGLVVFILGPRALP